MKSIQETSLKIFKDAALDRISRETHANIIIWWIDDLAKLIENIRETSIHDVDARVRLESLSKTTGISITTLWRFYDRD